MMTFSADLTWRALLLTAVFAADLLLLAGLCREELRNWRFGRYAPARDRVAEAAPVPASNRRTPQNHSVVR